MIPAPRARAVPKGRMGPSGRPRRSGLTLIEILISTMLISIVMTVATTAFMQMKAMASRIEARQQLHNSARVLFERLNWEVSSLMQGSAFFVTCRSPIASPPGSIEMIFLRGKLDPLDFTLGSNYGGFANCVTDQVWSRWTWDGERKRITVSASSQSRSFTADQDFMAGTYNYKGRGFRNLPTPQRVVLAGSPAATLDANAYGTGATEDIGDYQDLLGNAVPITVNCTDFRIEVVCQDGSTYAAPGAVDSSFAANGQLVDGRGGADLAKRPRLIRIRATLSAKGGATTETFSFSFQAPALLPGS